MEMQRRRRCKLVMNDKVCVGARSKVDRETVQKWIVTAGGHNVLATRLLKGMPSSRRFALTSCLLTPIANDLRTLPGVSRCMGSSHGNIVLQDREVDGRMSHMRGGHCAGDQGEDNGELELDLGRTPDAERGERVSAFPSKKGPGGPEANTECSRADRICRLTPSSTDSQFHAS